MTANDIRAMTDKEIATHFSGGYGPHKREEITAVLRQILDRAGDKPALDYRG